MPGCSRRNAALAPLLLVTLAFRAPAASGSEPNAPGRHATGDDGAGVVVAWNEVAFDVGHAEDQLRTFKTQRAMAMAHLAMHDAVNAVMARFAPYAFEASDPDADPVVAAAHAAHAVLVDQYPGARARLDAVLAPWRARRAADPAAARGAAVGERAAAAVLAARRDDGWDEPGSYAFASGPGAYQTTPPWDSFVLQPGFRHARPFALRSADQLRPPPPPPAGSAESAAALEEVRRQGARDGGERSADQSAYAVWWMEFAEGSVNRLARELVGRRGLGLAEAARLFALLDVSLYDSYVATWDSKFEYGHWRPSTAIHASASGVDPAAAAAAAAWEPMLPAPPFPEYVSAHAAGCASAFEVLRRVLGDGGAFAMRTTTAPAGMPERRFPDFSTAAAECADSRVRLGWHFRYATDAGLELGRAAARWVVEHHLLPRRGSPEPP